MTPGCPRPRYPRVVVCPTYRHYRDVRDDRALSYFELAPGETRTFKLRLNAAYQGRFYLPPVAVEAMYDPTLHTRSEARWIEVKPLAAAG